LFYLKNVNAKMENLIVNDNFYAQELSVEEMEGLSGGADCEWGLFTSIWKGVATGGIAGVVGGPVGVVTGATAGLFGGIVSGLIDRASCS
jgi:hypothetical protein